MPHPALGEVGGAGQASVGAGDAHQAGAGLPSVQVALMEVSTHSNSPSVPSAQLPPPHRQPLCGATEVRTLWARGEELGTRGGAPGASVGWAAVLRCPISLQNPEL